MVSLEKASRSWNDDKGAAGNETAHMGKSVLLCSAFYVGSHEVSYPGLSGVWHWWSLWWLCQGDWGTPWGWLGGTGKGHLGLGGALGCSHPVPAAQTLGMCPNSSWRAWEPCVSIGRACLWSLRGTISAFHPSAELPWKDVQRSTQKSTSVDSVPQITVWKKKISEQSPFPCHNKHSSEVAKVFLRWPWVVSGALTCLKNEKAKVPN